MQAINLAHKFLAKNTSAPAAPGAATAGRGPSNRTSTRPADAAKASGTTVGPAAENARASSTTPTPTSTNNTKVERCKRVREAIRHLWTGYRAAAWGADEVRPISGRRADAWGEVGMTILETLDTLWLAGLTEEFAEGERWVAALEFRRLDHASRVSFFELVIRGLGGLLSAYGLSHRPALLQKARALGEQLLWAFLDAGARRPGVAGQLGKARSPHAWPVAYIDAHNPSDVEITPGFHAGYSALADVGSNILEFAYLSRATGDPKYEAAANGTMQKLLAVSARERRAFLPKHLQPYQAATQGGALSIGAEADSYFEYLLKRYLQGRDGRILEVWKAAMREMRAAFIHVSPEGLTYISADSTFPLVMDHITCFVGGMLALAAQLVPKGQAEGWWLATASELTRTCVGGLSWPRSRLRLTCRWHHM